MLTCFLLGGTAILGCALFVAAKLYFVISLLGGPPSLPFCRCPVRVGGPYPYAAAGLSRLLQSALVPC
jgi:hypothetical protein